MIEVRTVKITYVYVYLGSWRLRIKKMNSTKDIEVGCPPESFLHADKYTDFSQ